MPHLTLLHGAALHLLSLGEAPLMISVVEDEEASQEQLQMTKARTMFQMVEEIGDGAGAVDGTTTNRNAR